MPAHFVALTSRCIGESGPMTWPIQRGDRNVLGASVATSTILQPGHHPTGGFLSPGR